MYYLHTFTMSVSKILTKDVIIFLLLITIELIKLF